MPKTTTDLTDIAPEESPLLDALEQFSQFIDELYDSPRTHAIHWEGNPNRIAVRSVERVLCKWRHAVKPNRPPGALVVRLARRLPSVLSDIAGHPKRILQRRRAMEPINRLRELDSNCVRWLTRQPGNTLAEKSGHRRAVLAVQRYESVDTLENRVVLDLLRRCSALAVSYLRQHRPRFPNHQWVRMTDDFLKLCRRLEALPHLQEVSGLPSLPKPNYVLLHETRYKEVWRSYTEVIRQQRRRQQLWQWRHQAFADMATVGWMSSASRLVVDPVARRAAHRFDLRIRETPLRGGFFDWACCPPIWKLTSGSAFYIGPTKSLGYLPKTSFMDFSDHDGTSIATWNATKLSTRLLRIDFAGEHVQGAPDFDLTKKLAAINLINFPHDSLDEEASHRLVVPLSLLEKPDALDGFQNEWCL